MHPVGGTRRAVVQVHARPRLRVHRPGQRRVHPGFGAVGGQARGTAGRGDRTAGVEVGLDVRVVGGADHLGQVPGAEPVLDFQLGAADRGGQRAEVAEQDGDRAGLAAARRVDRGVRAAGVHGEREVGLAASGRQRAGAEQRGGDVACCLRGVWGEVVGVPAAQCGAGFGDDALQGLDSADGLAFGAQAGEQAAPPGDALVASDAVDQADAGEPDPRDRGPGAVVSVVRDAELAVPAGRDSDDGERGEDAGEVRVLAVLLAGRDERAGGELVLPAEGEQGV